MFQWLKARWSDVKGNVKFAAILLGGSVIVSSVMALTNGLEMWQQFFLALCFVFMLGWSAVATWIAMNSRQVHAQGFMQTIPVGVASATEGVGIALVEARPEPAPRDVSKLKYPRKLSVLLRNDTNSQIVVSAPDWISGRSTVPFHPPFWSILQNENSAAGGWRSDRWLTEQSTTL